MRGRQLNGRREQHVGAIAKKEEIKRGATIKTQFDHLAGKAKMAAHNRQNEKEAKPERRISKAWSNPKPKRRNSAKPHLC